MALWIILAALTAEAGEGDAPLSAQYGFHAPEVYKLDFRTSNLIARDVDGDGKLDLVVVNNLKNRVDVLAQRGPNSTPTASRRKTNEILDDQRLEHRKIPMRRAVSSLDVADLNGDGRADLVYLGNPSGLYVEYQQPDGTFGQERIFENADVVGAAWTLDAADLDGDGRKDVAFVGRQYLHLAYQDANGRLGNFKRFRLGQDGVGLLRVLDVDGDGRVDIVYFSQTSELPLRVRFQEPDGAFGPERRMRIDPPRGVSFADVDGKPGQEILAISALNQRFTVYGLAKSEPSEDRPTSQIEIFPFDLGGAGKSTDLAVADFTGDGRMDVAASDVDSTQLSFFPQAKSSTTFPWTLGAEALRPVDADGDGRSGLLSLSPKDKSIVVGVYESGRMTFPQAIPTTGEPAAMEVVGEGPQARILYITKTTVADGKTGFALRRLKPGGAGDRDWTADAFGDKEQINLDFSVKPSDLRAVDVNADGRLDLLVLWAYKPPMVLLGLEDGAYQPAPDTGKGTFGNLSSADVWFGPLLEGRPALLVAQDGFARNLRMQQDHRWEVLDQYNASSGSAKVKGVAALDLAGDETPEIVMYDRASQSLVMLRKEDGVFRAWQSLKVGPFDVRGMRTADFNADGSMDLLLFDGEKMGIVYSRAGDLIVRPLASYESDNKDGQLYDLAPGDLNGNGRMDVLLLDPVDHNLEIVTFTGEGRIERATRWQVFEEKTFNRESGGPIEPREAIVADLNADGLEDVALLVHDRVLVYLQDAGEDDPADANVSSRD